MAADGSIIIETEIDDKKAQQELNRLTKKIDALQEKLNQKQGKQSALAEEARQIGIEYDRARSWSKCRAAKNFIPLPIYRNRQIR